METILPYPIDRLTCVKKDQNMEIHSSIHSRTDQSGCSI